MFVLVILILFPLLSEWSLDEGIRVGDHILGEGLSWLLGPWILPLRVFTCVHPSPSVYLHDFGPGPHLLMDCHS